MPKVSQDLFRYCYRGTQNALRHSAYMRMSKVLLIRALLRQTGVNLEGRAVFDYGFGAGTFFRYCPPQAHLHGVELDPACVAEVSRMLGDRGYRNIDLAGIEPERWSEHPLLARQYDLIVCSHVLEHLPDAAAFLERIACCLKEGGLFIGLVPINERQVDSHHVREVTQPLLVSWLPRTGLELGHWVETDTWLYWIQPLFTHSAGWKHSLAQGLSLGIGLIATCLGPRLWWPLSNWFGRMTFSKPTQAGFVLTKRS